MSRGKPAEPKPQTEIEQAIAEIQKEKGAKHIRPASQLIPFNHISTGAFTLDYALMGGIPEGLATLIYGWESSGKSTISDRIVASTQRKYPDRRAIYVDMENTFDANWAAKHGVNTDELQLVQPESGEEAVDIMASLMEAWETSLIVLDSIPATVPYTMVERSAEDPTMSRLAALMGVLSSKILMSWIKERKRGHWVTLLLINQFRSTVGGFIVGDPRTLPGGHQINKYLPTTKIELKNKEQMGKDSFELDVVEMNNHSFKITKAKGGTSIRSGEFQMVVSPDSKYPMGTILDAATVLTYGRKMELVTGGGQSWHIDGVDQKFGNLAAMEEYLYANEPEFLRLKQQIISMQRVAKGLTKLPPDEYLLDWNAKDNLEND